MDHPTRSSMRRPRRRFLLVLAVVATACASAGGFDPGTPRPQRDWRSLVGCYREGDWHFALDSIPFVGVFADEEGARIARSSVGDGRVETLWRMTAPDSVRLRFEHGMYGHIYRFAVRGDTLAGLVTTSTDIVLPRKPKPERVRAVRAPCPPAAAFSSPLPDSATAATLYGYTAARPTEAQLAADPWGAVAPFRAWLAAHPEALAKWRMRYNARTVFWRAANSDVRTNARELVGTYRLEVERTGGPTHVFYGRTEIRPRHALRTTDTAAVFLQQPPGYRLRFTLARDSSSLPRPGPGRRHRDAYGGNGPDNGWIDVRLPAIDSADGTRRFRAFVPLVNFAWSFRGDDRELYDWDHEWRRGHYREDAINAFAEFVLWPDGRVTFTQREELTPGRVVTLRGERVSGAAWECSGDQCD
jgi:hypothetical protein